MPQSLGASTLEPPQGRCAWAPQEILGAAQRCFVLHVDLPLVLPSKSLATLYFLSSTRCKF